MNGMHCHHINCSVSLTASVSASAILRLVCVSISVHGGREESTVLTMISKVMKGRPFLFESLIVATSECSAVCIGGCERCDEGKCFTFVGLLRVHFVCVCACMRERCTFVCVLLCVCVYACNIAGWCGDIFFLLRWVTNPRYVE